MLPRYHGTGVPTFPKRRTLAACLCVHAVAHWRGSKAWQAYWHAARKTTVSFGQSPPVGAWPETHSEALHFSAVRMSTGSPDLKPLARQALVTAGAQSGAPLPAVAQTSCISTSFDGRSASNVDFMASWVAAADCLLKLSSFDCWSFILALKSATDLSHQLPKSLRKPRFSAGCGGSGGGGCGGSVTAADGAGGATGAEACPGAGVAGAAAAGAVAAAGGWAVCATTKSADAKVSTRAASPQRPADRKCPELKLRGVTATPSWPAPAGQTELYPLADAITPLPIKFGVNMVRLRAPQRQSH